MSTLTLELFPTLSTHGLNMSYESANMTRSSFSEAKSKVVPFGVTPEMLKETRSAEFASGDKTGVGGVPIASKMTIQQESKITINCDKRCKASLAWEEMEPQQRVDLDFGPEPALLGEVGDCTPPLLTRCVDPFAP